MGTTMCEVKLYDETGSDKYTCKKCGRKAEKEKKLCKPKKIKEKDPQ